MERTSRRTFVKAAGAVTGAAWVAPQLISVPAAGAATVPPAPEFIACAGAHSVPGNDLTITIGAGAGELNAQPGDFLVAMAAHHIDNNHVYDVATPTGWTDLGDLDSLDNGGQDPGVCTRVFTKVVAGGDASYTFQLTPQPVASTAFTLLIAAFRGAVVLDPATPAQATTESGVTTITVGGITPSIPNVLSVVLIGSENPEQPWSEATGYTEVCDYFPNTSVPEIYIAVADLNTTSIPAATFTSSGSGHPDAAWMLGLSPVN